MSGQHCLSLLMLLLCLLAGQSAARQLPPATTSDNRQLFSELETRMQQLFQQRATAIGDLKADLKKQATAIDRLRTDLASYKKKVDAPPVAFTVRLSRSKDNGGQGLRLGRHQTVVFDDIITNTGSAYDPRHGIFTAPSSGVYVFFLTDMAVTGRSSIQLKVVKNGNTLDATWAQGTGGSHHDQGSTLVTTHLTTGDQVWVRQDSGFNVRAKWYTVFSGFKLH